METYTHFVQLTERQHTFVGPSNDGSGFEPGHSEWVDCEAWVCVENIAVIRHANTGQSKQDGIRTEVVLDVGDSEGCYTLFVGETVAEVGVKVSQSLNPVHMVTVPSHHYPGSVTRPAPERWDKPFPAGVVVPSDMASGLREQVQRDIDEHELPSLPTLPGATDAITAFDEVLASAGPPPADPEVTISKWAPNEYDECENCGYVKTAHCRVHPGEPCCPGDPDDPCMLPPEGVDMEKLSGDHDDQCESEFLNPPGAWTPCGCEGRLPNAGDVL